MGARKILRTSDRQPSGRIEINWSDGLTRGLIFAASTFIDKNASFRDITGLSGDLVYEYPSDYSFIQLDRSISSRFGPVAGIGGTDYNAEIFFPTSQINSRIAASGSVTFFGLIRSQTNDIGGNAGGFLLGNGGALAEHYPFSDGKIYSSAFTNTRWVDGFTPPTPITDIHSIAFSAQSGSQVAYYNGVQAATGSVAATPAMSAGRFASGPQHTSTVKDFAYAAFFWSRILSPNELKSVHDNPWRLFRSPARTYFVPSAGGGGATLTADSGTYTLTGTAATLKADRKLAADSGSYAITGTDVSLKLGRKLTAESGTYTVNGTDVSLTAGRKLTADSGTYALTGTDVTLTYQPAGGYTLALDSGSYTLTGTAATLKASRKLTADSGTYALTGTDVTLTRGFKITADSGTYTLTGSNVAFARTYRLPADSGSYALSGSPVSLSWSGEVVPVAPTHGGPSIYGKAVFREAEFKREYEREVSRIENERIRAIQMREDEEIVIIMAALAA